MDKDSFVESAELPVILFLVGMMIIVGALRDLGFFTWIVQWLKIGFISAVVVA